MVLNPENCHEQIHLNRVQGETISKLKTILFCGNKIFVYYGILTLKINLLHQRRLRLSLVYCILGKTSNNSEASLTYTLGYSMF